MQPVMFSLEAPDIKRGIAALKYIKIINNLLRPLESPMAAKKEPHKTTGRPTRSQVRAIIAAHNRFQKIPRRELICGGERWMEECLRVSYTVKPLSYLSRNGEFLVDRCCISPFTSSMSFSPGSFLCYLSKNTPQNPCRAVKVQSTSMT